MKIRRVLIGGGLVVISMHGAALWPAQQMNLSRWNRLADEYGFIVVYPSGTAVPKSWGGNADVRFISELIDTLEAAYNVDPTRIYKRIAAVGTVAPALLRPSGWCTDSRPMPLISFHGTADPMAPYDGGTSVASPPRFITGTSIPFASVSTWAAYWARRNHCGPNPIDSVVAADVTRAEYLNCADDAPVVLYTIRGGGHSWPGGKPMPEWMVGPTSRNLDASKQMWAFFREHRLRRK